MRIRLRFWIIAAVSVAVAVVVGLHLFNQYGPDLLQVRSWLLGGSNAINCGTVPIGGSPKNATECALAAQGMSKPFRVRYEIRGYDSEVAVAIVRSPSGEVSALEYDSDTHGGGGRGHQAVWTEHCPVPVHLWVNPSGRLNCFQRESSPPKNLTSPNMEPY